MKIWFIPRAAIASDADTNDLSALAQPGELTTDHAACSYGQPVIVDEHGRSYGPGDVWEGEYAGESGMSRDLDLEEAASRAGFVRESNYDETATTY